MSWWTVTDLPGAPCRRPQGWGLRISVRAMVAVLAISSLTACADFRERRARAQNPAITGSIASNPDVRAAGERVTQSASRVDVARSAMLPTSSLNADIVESQNGSSGSGESQRTVGFRFDLPLFNGFSNLNAVRGAQANMRAAEQSFDFTRDQAVVDLVSAIAGARRDQKAVDIRDTELAGLARFLGEAEQRQTAGIVSATDVHQIRTQLASTRAGLSGAKADLQASIARRTALAGEMDLGSLTILDVSRSLPTSEEEALEVAIANNAALQELAWRQEAADREIRVADGAFLPNVDLSVTGDHYQDRVVTPTTSSKNELEVRIGVSLPLFDGGARRAESLAARSAFRESSYNYQAARRDLVVTIKSIWARAQAAADVTRYAESRLASARSAFTGVREGRRIGARSVRDELEARKDILDAELSLHDARYEELVANHQLLLQTGRVNTVYHQD